MVTVPGSPSRFSLWQSTGFAAMAVLLALALRANSARARYGLWLAASVKFLIPFSVLAAMGGYLGRWLIPATPVARVPVAIEEIVQPFAPFQGAGVPAAVSVPAPAGVGVLPVVLLAIWLCGLVAVVLHWWVRWRRVAAAVRGSTPLAEGREVEALRRLRWGGRSFSVVCQQGSSKALTGHKKRWPVPLWGLLAPQSITLVSSRARLEPGVFGIFRPVLWLPAGIGDRLNDAELEAILAHELCHARRRDNLAAAIHMGVEAIFWFHPLVWWLGARLTEERERACDEEVVRMGGEPQVYAEGILKVCEFYLASPVICAAGVSGGGLKNRIEGIMANRIFHKLNFAQKLLLAVAAIGAVAGPIAAGLFGQAAPPPAFEVASVKLADPATPPPYAHTGGPGTSDPGRIHYSQATITSLLLEAYDVQLDQVSGLSNWARGMAGMDFYVLDATMPPETTKAQFRLMLQDLLAGRFHLVVHHETRNFPGYALVVAAGGPKMKETAEGPNLAPAEGVAAQGKDKAGFPILPPGPRMAATVSPGALRLRAQAQSMGQFATALSVTINRVQGAAGNGVPRPRVVDKTGLTGKYDFELECACEGCGPPPGVPATETDAPPAALASDPMGAGLPSIFTALGRQLGLRLEKLKDVPVDVIVIDHLDMVPTQN